MKKYSYLVLVLLCCIVLVGCGSDEKKVGKHEFVPLKSAGYYSDLRFVPNGEFFVRGKLNEEDAKKHGVVFKVEVDENKRIKQITAMDSGKPINTEWHDTLYFYSGIVREIFTNRKFSTISIEYQNDTMELFFKKSDMSSAWYYSYSIRYKYDDKKHHAISAHLYNHSGELSDKRSGFSTMLFGYNEQGQLEKIGYFDKSGDRVVTVSKKYETRFKYDTKKHTALPVEMANYGKDGALMADEEGIAKITYDYDQKGRLTEVRHFGIDESLKARIYFDGLDIVDIYEQPTYYRYGAITKYIYSEDGENPALVAFYGKDGQRIVVPLSPEYADDRMKSTISALNYTYTNEGRVATIEQLGINDAPCGKYNIDGRPWDKYTKYAISYDVYGNVERYTTYDKDNHVVAASSVNPVAITQYKYDDKRHKVEESYYGADERPVEAESSYGFDRKYMVHRLVYEYNDENEQVKTTGYDKNGKKVAEREHK